jgi:hypothetical protein
MSQVGQFPGIQELRRRTVRQPVNPMDRATVVSIYPKDIEEVKHTIEPGRFRIKAGSYETPTLLVVGPSSWWREIDEDQPLLEIPVSSIQIADSVVRDYCNGILASNMGDTMPGLFYVPGEHTIQTIKKSYLAELDKAAAKQKKFYTVLVMLADALWARSQGNPLAISDDMRMAARELNLTETKDWMRDFKMVNQVRCKACGSLKNPEFPICASCHFPDPDHPMTAKLLAIKGQTPVQ